MDRETKDALDELREKHNQSTDRASRIIEEGERIQRQLREVLDSYRKADEQLDDHSRRRP